MFFYLPGSGSGSTTLIRYYRHDYAAAVLSNGRSSTETDEDIANIYVKISLLVFAHAVRYFSSLHYRDSPAV
jgi:hypothetical protein